MSACEVATDADTARLRIRPFSSLLHEAERPYRRELLSDGYGVMEQQHFSATNHGLTHLLQ